MGRLLVRPKLAGEPSVFPSLDSFYSDVTLLLHGEGSDGSTTFIDNSSAERVPTVNGGAEIDTAQFVYGSASVHLPSSSPVSTLVYDNDTQQIVDLGADFTIEMRIRPTTISGSFDNVLLSHYRASANVNGFAFFVAASDSKVKFFGYNSSGTAVANLVSTTVLSAGTWYAVAVTYDHSASTARLFVNGTLEATDTSASGMVNQGSQADFMLGNTSGFNAQMVGHFDEIRITKACRYTATYTVAGKAFPDL